MLVSVRFTHPVALLHDDFRGSPGPRKTRGRIDLKPPHDSAYGR